MFTLNCKGNVLNFQNPLVMGILNITADSFYAASRHQYMDSLLKTAGNMLAEGAAILDIGGQSTRPGSKQITAEAELALVIPAIREIRHAYPEALISIDTFYSKVAAMAVQEGAALVNDISAGQLDEKMFDTVAALQVPYILMHMQGKPDHMQLNPYYEDVTKEVLYFLVQKIGQLRAKGVIDIIVDPGFGFGKTHAHNFKLLKELNIFEITGCPVLLGISRKGTIYKTLGVSADEALNGTTVLNTIGLLKGAAILRVHDVKEAAETIKLIERYW